MFTPLSCKDIGARKFDLEVNLNNSSFHSLLGTEVFQVYSVQYTEACTVNNVHGT